MSVIIPKDCFHQPQVADLRLIACPGAEELTNLIDKHLVRWASEAGYQTNSFIIESACPRFQSGDAKGLVKESVRGDDIFIVVDPGNYSVTYKLFNYENHLSPDDHFLSPEASIYATLGSFVVELFLMQRSLIFITISVTSSFTPGRDENSCRTPLILT